MLNGPSKVPRDSPKPRGKEWVQVRERSERAEARREHALSQLEATARGHTLPRGHTTNGLPHRRAAEELCKQVLYHTSSIPEQCASLIWLICNSL